MWSCTPQMLLPYLYPNMLVVTVGTFQWGDATSSQEQSWINANRGELSTINEVHKYG